MRIDDIELIGYKRLMYDQAGTFRMTLSQKIQLILGTNGCGKSSLVHELSPLPPDGNDFHKGGSKTLRIFNRGDIYVLKNEFHTKAGTHSFIKNGIEMNKEGLVTSQLELCWSEFRINKKVRELLMGKRKFTAMRPMERREWLTLLADTDFDYALNVYNQLRERLRDADRDVRRDQGRLTIETSKIITPEEQVRLKKEVEEIHHELSDLIAIRKPIEHSVQTLEDRQQKGMVMLNEMSTRLLRMRLHAPLTAYGNEEPRRNDWYELEKPQFKSVEQIDAHMVNIKERIAAEEALINQAVKDHGKLQQNLTVLKKTGQEGLTTLATNLQILNGQRMDTLEGLKLRLDVADPQVALIAFDSCHDVLFQIFSEIPENEDKRFSQATRQTLQTELAKHRETAFGYKSRLDKLEAQAAHMEKHLSDGKVDCPKCGHRFTPGFTDAGLRSVREQIEKGTKLHSEVTASITKHEEKLAEFDAYAALYRQYTGCVSGYPALKPLWDYLSEKDLPVSAPRMILTVLAHFRQDMMVMAHVNGMSKQIDDIKELMKQKALVGDVSLAETQLKLEEISLQVEGMTAHLARLKLKYSEYAQYRREIVEALDLGKKIEKLKSDLTLVTGEMVDTMWMETVHHCIRQLQSQLNRKEETLNEVKQQQIRVDDLQKSIDRALLDKKALEVLVDTLSPKDGLIAEGLMGFIKTYTRQINQIIKKVWSYPLVVKECAMGGDGRVELDYKFPLIVLGDKPTVDDVEEGSLGQREIIDLAFKIVAMRYLGLSHSSLILDEFGASFDKAHQTNAVEMIKTLMDTTQFSQLFMISHYHAAYGAFANVETCVLDAKNIVVPDLYNQHVTIH